MSKKLPAVKKLTSNFRAPPAYFTFAPPQRPGALDAFRLPSIINGAAVPRAQRPEAEKGAIVL